MRIALISCTKNKKNYSCPGKEMFTQSELFKLSYAYAGQLVEKIYILSTQYGLLPEDVIIEPYDRTLSGKSETLKRNFANSVLTQMDKEFDLDQDEFIILASSDFYKYLIPELKNYQLPLKNKNYHEKLVYLRAELE